MSSAVFSCFRNLIQDPGNLPEANQEYRICLHKPQPHEFFRVRRSRRFEKTEFLSLYFGDIWKNHGGLGEICGIQLRFCFIHDIIKVQA